jgi:hypothetical protein
LLQGLRRAFGKQIWQPSDVAVACGLDELVLTMIVHGSHPLVNMFTKSEGQQKDHGNQPDAPMLRL